MAYISFFQTICAVSLHYFPGYVFGLSATPKQDLSTSDSCMIMHLLTRYTLWLSFWNQRRSSTYNILHFHQTWPSETIFCFQNSNIINLERDTIKEMTLDQLFISIWCPHWQVWKLLPNVDWPAIKVYSGRWTVFWRASQMVLKFAAKEKKMTVTLFLEQPS